MTYVAPCALDPPSVDVADEPEGCTPMPVLLRSVHLPIGMGVLLSGSTYAKIFPLHMKNNTKILNFKDKLMKPSAFSLGSKDVVLEIMDDDCVVELVDRAIRATTSEALRSKLRGPWININTLIMRSIGVKTFLILCIRNCNISGLLKATGN